MAEMRVDDVLRSLDAVIAARRDADSGVSYVASLLRRGEDKILEKIGEEAVETILASKSGDARAIVHETADLWFHCLVMLAFHGLGSEDVLGELQRRFGVSGHEEKAARTSGEGGS